MLALNQSQIMRRKIGTQTRWIYMMNDTPLPRKRPWDMDMFCKNVFNKRSSTRHNLLKQYILLT